MTTGKTKPSYRPPTTEREIRLQLSRNESFPAIDVATEFSRLGLENVNRYPSMASLQSALGKWLSIDEDRFVISAGGDDALDRFIRLAMTREKKTILTHAPSFEMVNVYTNNHGGNVTPVPWQAVPFPEEAFLDQIDDSVAAIVLVSPNNPTGETIDDKTLVRIANVASERGIRVLVDNAYIEFADQNPIDQLAEMPGVFVLRTFSKAWGMAGLRVGYMIAPNRELALELREATGPFPVSNVSLALAYRAVTERVDAMTANVEMTKQIRAELTSTIRKLGGVVTESQGNFVLVQFENAEEIWEKLNAEGILVRKFPTNPQLENRLRITCPSNSNDLLHLAKSLARATGNELEAGSIAVREPDLPLESAVSKKEDLRTASFKRKTKETDISIELNLDGTGKADIETGIGFLDHMLTALTFHSRMDLVLRCNGDLHIDDHHTAEDCALALGSAIDQALGPRTGIVRFGYAYAPLDEALARTVIDFSGRPWPEVNLALEREMVGTIATENITHIFNSLAMNLQCSLHVDVLRGTNDHHRAEAAFKSLALALRKALTRTDGSIPSTKGVI